MTTTDTPATKSGDDYERRWLADRLPLPTVDDVAGPMVRALLTLHHFGETGAGIDSALATDEMRDEWTVLQRHVADLICVMVGRCVIFPRCTEVEHAMRVVVDAITNADRQLAHFYERQVEHICYDA